MKRTIDILFSLFALVVLSPLLLVTVVCIVLESGRTVFFVQQRCGLQGRTFGMLKFRSMVKNADAIGPYFTAAGDTRITRTGRWIRRTSVDELPQIINVLRGDMSLVGPRPDVPAQRGLYTDAEWAERCSVRPGITGLAQVVNRSGGSEAERLALDLHYVRSIKRGFGVLLDAKIMAMTFGRLTGKGAN